MSAATVTRLRNPAALGRIREGIAARVQQIGASEDVRRRANGVALRELQAGRSPAVAYSLAIGAVSGRRNALLASGEQVPA